MPRALPSFCKVTREGSRRASIIDTYASLTPIFRATAAWVSPRRPRDALTCLASLMVAEHNRQLGCCRALAPERLVAAPADELALLDGRTDMAFRLSLEQGLRGDV